MCLAGELQTANRIPDFAPSSETPTPPRRLKLREAMFGRAGRLRWAGRKWPLLTCDDLQFFWRNRKMYWGRAGYVPVEF
jgi:hypothetical protein